MSLSLYLINKQKEPTQVVLKELEERVMAEWVAVHPDYIERVDQYLKHFNGVSVETEEFILSHEQAVALQNHFSPDAIFILEQRGRYNYCLDMHNMIASILKKST